MKSPNLSISGAAGTGNNERGETEPRLVRERPVVLADRQDGKIALRPLPPWLTLSPCRPPSP
jgi:hypothetical protein